MLILPGFVAQSSRWFAALTPHCDAVPHVAVAQGAGATPDVLAAPPANHQVLREIPAPRVCCCCCAPSTSFGRRGRGLGGGVQWGLHAHFFPWRHPRLQSTGVNADVPGHSRSLWAGPKRTRASRPEPSAPQNAPQHTIDLDAFVHRDGFAELLTVGNGAIGQIPALRVLHDNSSIQHYLLFTFIVLHSLTAGHEASPHKHILVTVTQSCQKIQTSHCCDLQLSYKSATCLKNLPYASYSK